jgi:single-strand DNA-binding protein
LVFIEGRIKTRSWDDQSGNKKHITEIVADVMTLLSKRSDEHITGTEKPSSQQESVSSSPMSDASGITDDLPF